MFVILKRKRETEIRNALEHFIHLEELELAFFVFWKRILLLVLIFIFRVWRLCLQVIVSSWQMPGLVPADILARFWK